MMTRPGSLFLLLLLFFGCSGSAAVDPARQEAFQQISIADVRLGQTLSVLEARLGKGKPTQASTGGIFDYDRPHGPVRVLFRKEVSNEIGGTEVTFKSESLKKGDSKERVREVMGAPDHPRDDTDYFPSEHWHLTVYYGDKNQTVERFHLQAVMTEAERAELDRQADEIGKRNRAKVGR